MNLGLIFNPLAVIMFICRKEFLLLLFMFFKTRFLYSFGDCPGTLCRSALQVLLLKCAPPPPSLEKSSLKKRMFGLLGLLFNGYFWVLNVGRKTWEFRVEI